MELGLPGLSLEREGRKKIEEGPPAFQGKWEGLGLGRVWEAMASLGVLGAQTLGYPGRWGSQALEHSGVGVWSAIAGSGDWWGRAVGEWEELPKFLSRSRKAPELEELWGPSIGKGV